MIHSQLRFIKAISMRITIILCAVIQFITSSASNETIHTPHPPYRPQSPQTNINFRADRIIDIPIDTTCPHECLSAMKQLDLLQSDNTMCCWMYSTDMSHRIYIDVNMAKQLGSGTWATVYDVQMHYQVKYDE